MLASVLNLGLQSLERLAAKATAKTSAETRTSATPHPLAAYPQLHTLLVEAEKSGTLAAERSRIIGRRYAV